jgi:hypothetical protein
VVEKGSCGNKLGISQVGSNPRVVFFLSFMWDWPLISELLHRNVKGPLAPWVQWY